METKIVKIDPLNIRDEKLQSAINFLKMGEIIGFPTETVYGLGGLIKYPNSIYKIFKVKNRPADNPLIVHISNLDMLKNLVLEIPSNIKKICEKYWPGPLTILFRKSPQVSDIITAGLDTVAIRMPSHPVAHRLIELTNNPIAAPSANLSGRPSPTTADHVFHDLEGKIPLIIDSGKCEYGVESTVIDVNRDPPLILRPGGLNYEELLKLIPHLKTFDNNDNTKHEKMTLLKKPSTPGLKYKHYSPKAYVILINKPYNQILTKLKLYWSKYNKRNKKIGIIHTHNHIDLPPEIKNNENTLIIDLTVSKSCKKTMDVEPKLVARELFASLRTLDSQGAEIILIEGISKKKEGLAVMNRLIKAASEVI